MSESQLKRIARRIEEAHRRALENIADAILIINGNSDMVQPSLR